MTATEAEEIDWESPPRLPRRDEEGKTPEVTLRVAFPVECSLCGHWPGEPQPMVPGDPGEIHEARSSLHQLLIIPQMPDGPVHIICDICMDRLGLV